MEANIQTNTGLTDFLSTEALPKRTLDIRRGNINAIKALLEKEPEETVLFSDPRPFDNNGIIEKINFGIPVQLKRFVQIYESLEAIEIRKPYAKEFFNKLLDFADTGTVNFGNRDKLFKLFLKNSLYNDEELKNFDAISKEMLEIRAVIRYLFPEKSRKNRANSVLKRMNFVKVSNPDFYFYEEKWIKEKVSTTIHNMDKINRFCRNYLAEELKTYKFNEEDASTILKCFDLVAFAHYYQRRGSGDPYIFHPLAVALSAIKSGEKSVDVISGLLLHDVVEDQVERVVEYYGDFTFRLTKGFFPDESEPAYIKISGYYNKRIAEFVRELTKPPSKSNGDLKIKKKEARVLFDKLRRTKDPSVIIGKCRDRLNNLQTIDGLKTHKFISTIIETTLELLPLLDMVLSGTLENKEARPVTQEEIVEAKRLKSLIKNEIFKVGKLWVFRINQEYSERLKQLLIDYPRDKDEEFHTTDVVFDLVEKIVEKQKKLLGKVEELYPDIEKELTKVMSNAVKKVSLSFFVDDAME